jgi:hypothetical protein
MCVYGKSFQTLIALVAVAIVVVTDENTRELHQGKQQ